MNKERPPMKEIKEEIRIYDRPTAMNSQKMYDYILALEAEIKTNQDKNK